MRIINEVLLDQYEKDLIKEVLDFWFTSSIRFRDFDGKMEIEISPERKIVPGSPVRRRDIERALDSAKTELEDKHRRLSGLVFEAKEYYTKKENPPQYILDEIQALEKELGILGKMLESYEAILANIAAGGYYSPKQELLGEFVSSPTPKVILYLGSYDDVSDRYKTLISVFVHEMFHALNYFLGNGARTLREMDEPMVEFATGVFLDAAKGINPVFGVINARHRRNVAQKANCIGEVACYGFGRYLMDNARRSKHDELEWIEEYAKKSASIDPVRPEAKRIVIILNPFYPSGRNEAWVMRMFEVWIFGKKGGTLRAKTTTLKVTRRDGTVLQMGSARDTLVSAILEAGIRRVYDLKIICCQGLLVDDKMNPNPKYAGEHYLDPNTQLYILCHSNTKDKKKYLDKVSAALNLGWKVEVV